MSMFNALMDPRQVGSAFQQGYDQGEERAGHLQAKRALDALSANPNDPRAFAAVMRNNPELALRIKQERREDTRFQDERAFNSAMAEYVAGPQSRGMLGTPQANDLMPPLSGTFGQSEQQPANGLDLGFLGQPETRHDQLFLQMMRRNPLKAMQIQSKMRDSLVDRLEAERKTFDWAVSRFAGVGDEESYQHARQELQERLGGWGQGIMDQLPASFPGVQELDNLRLRALDAKEQIAHFQRQANIDADNARADRNLDDQIGHRAQQRQSLDRYRRDRIAVTERGQDISATTRRRGQDVSDATRRRGQDMGGRSAGSQRQNIRVVSSPDEARKLPKGTVFKTPDGKIKVR